MAGGFESNSFESSVVLNGTQTVNTLIAFINRQGLNKSKTVVRAKMRDEEDRGY